MRVKNFGIITSISVFVVAVAAMGGLIAGFNNTVKELDVAVTENKADVILANAAIGDNTITTVPILYYDQVMDDCANIYNVDTQALVNARQFEWKTCDYHSSDIETGLVEPELDAQFLPVAVGGKMLPNRGLAEGFSRWFNQVDGKSKSYAGNLSLTYNATDLSFEYKNDNFYPLDMIAPMSSESVNSDGHNHLFTLSLGIPFSVLADGNEEFSLFSDDDTWVFVGNTLVLDMGGIHDAVEGKFRINERGEIYTSVGGEDFAYSGVDVNAGTGAIIRIFHADRNSESSVFNVKMFNMVPNVLKSNLAQSGEVELAYDPENPSYVAPLGESLSVGPDKSRSLAAIVTTQVVAIGAVAALLIMSISAAWKYSHRDRSQVK